MKVFIGMCSGGSVRAETMTSVIAAMDLLKQKGIEVGLSVMIGGYTAHNRNKLVQEAKDNYSTHLMFIDADMIFPASGIMRLLDHDKDIVGGMYNARGIVGQPIISTIKFLDNDGNLPSDHKLTNFEIGPELFKCGGLGTGFMLIKMEVFDNLDKPYFVAWEDKDGEHHTEDIDFCVKTREAGFHVYCSPTIKIGHIGTQVY